MRKFLWPVIGAAVVVASFAVVVFGGGSPVVRDPMTGKSEWDIPVQDPALVAEGKDLYLAKCASCHGTDLRGTNLGPSHLSVVYNPDHHNDLSFARAALVGVPAHHWSFGDMAPVPGLTEHDMVRINAFVREMQRLEGFEPYPPR